MVHGEQRLPTDIIDVTNVMADIAMGAVFAQAEKEPPQLSSASEARLRSLLTDPFSLDEVERSKTRAAGFIWRLGAARNLSRLVLSHVHDVLSMDQTVGDLLDGEGIVSELLRRDPELLRDLQPSDEAAFWRLTGYDPQEEGYEPSRVGGLILLLRPATYVPEAIVEKIRDYRDSTSTMAHEPEIMGMVVNGVESVAEVAYPDEREQELREAGMRVFCAAFVIAHSQNAADKQVFQAALDDFAGRALIDAHGLDCALDITIELIEFSEQWDEQSRAALPPLLERLYEFIPAVDISLVDINQLCEMVTSAHRLQQITGEVRLLAFVARGLEVLSDFEAFGQQVIDPVTELGDADAGLDLKKMLASSQALSTRETVTRLLAELRDESPAPAPPAVEAVLSSLSEEGYAFEPVKMAIGFIASELNPAQRRALTDTFDKAIGQALRNLSPEHALRQADGLQAFNDNKLHKGYLAYFNSGRKFLDAKIFDYINLAADLMSRPEAWQGLQHPADFVAALCLSRIHDALWYNRHFYADGNDPSGTVAAAFRSLKTFVEFISSNSQSTGAQMILTESLAGLEAFNDWIQLPSADPQDIVSGDPIFAILSSYGLAPER